MQASLDSADRPSHVQPDGVGAMLRKRRLELGLSQADVANVVKLPPRRIEAMEEERWDELPDGPYLRGFLKNIARALNLDAATLMDRVDDSVVRARSPESILASTGMTRATLPRRSGPASERHGGRSLVFGALAFAVVAALIAWSGTESFQRAVVGGRGLIASVSSPTEHATPAPAQAPASTPEGRKEEPAVPPQVGAAAPGPDAQVAQTVSSPVADPAARADVASGKALRFHFNEDSWVEVRSADGKVLLSRLNPAGSEQTIEGEAPFSLVVGNAKGVALQFRGQPVDLAPYTRDQVARFTLS